MKIFSFWIYDINEERYIDENDKGDYWKFLDADYDEIKKTEIYLNNIIKVIKQIKNEILKEKMIKKLFDLSKENNLLLEYGDQLLDKEIFSDKEIIELISNVDYFTIIDEASKNIDKIDAGKVDKFIYIFFEIKDQNKQIEMFNKLLSTIKKYNDFPKYLVDILEKIYNKNPNIYKSLFNSWINEIPQYYLNYIKINSDNNYLYNKSLEYNDLKIGIDPRISIGPEVETNFINTLDISMIDQKNFENGFRVSDDATVFPGREIVCEPFHDTPDELARFKAVLDSLTEIGYYYDEKLSNAAGQINLGLSYLDSPQSIIYFYEIFCNCEELLYYISNEAGQQLRQPIYQNSRLKPISEIIGKRIVDEDITRNEVIYMFLTEDEKAFEKYGITGLIHKKNSVCLRGHNNGDYRFEIRIPNGGVNYNTWIDNIRLYGKIMEISKKIADALKKDYITEEEEKIIKLKLELEEPNLDKEDKLYILMDLLFDDEKIKQIYYDRFNSVIKIINETNTRTYKIPKVGLEPTIGDVEFSYQYKSKLIDPYEEDNNHTR